MKKLVFTLLTVVLLMLLLPLSVAAADTGALEPESLYRNDAPQSVDTVEEKADWVAQQCRDAGMTEDWEVALWLHNWIIFNADYDYTFTHYDAAGILLEGTGVCAGYTEAYSLLLNEFGIENKYLSAWQMNHAWNLVKLNGQWCHVDCTWDDSTLLGGKRENSWTEHDNYFGLNDEQMRKDHTWEVDASLACTSRINNYANQVSCGPDATWSFDESTGTLTISGTGDILWYPWKDAITASGFRIRDVMQKVEIGSGITGIGWGAFEWVSLEEVTIPDTVTVIGAAAFRYCYSLSGVTIPNGVKTIGLAAFQSCQSMKSITIPSGVTFVGALAFANTGISTVTIPATLTHMDESAFDDCYKLSGVVVEPQHPDYSSDSRGMLYNKDRTTLILVPSDSNGTITVPAGVTQIRSGIFRYCNWLRRIDVDPANTNFCSDEAGVLYDKYKNTLIAAPNELRGEYAVPAGVETIADFAFYGCSYLTGITIPDSVKTIGEVAFSSTHNLRRVTLGKGLATIGERAFYFSDVSEIRLPEGLTTIGDFAFSECYELTSITIPGSVKNLGISAFYGSHNLRQVTFSRGTTHISDFAFVGCDKLSTLVIPESLKTLGIYVFYDCDALKDIYYYGTEQTFAQIDTGYANTQFLKATVHFEKTPTGDLDGDFILTTDDAVYLLLHVMFGEEDYPSAAGMQTDMDHNGKLNADDAVYLLLHIMFGATDYPLSAA